MGSRRRAVTGAIAVSLLGLVAVSGCVARVDISGREWTKPDAGVARTTWDEYQCAWMPAESWRTPDLVVGGLADTVRFLIEERRREAEFDRCMTARGYRPAS
jgi:hypothetical protein